MVAFDVPPAGVSAGELAEVTLALPATASAVLLPNASLQRQGDQVGVWRVDGGSLRFASVRTGKASLDGQVQILEGVKAGEQVVVYSARELTAASRISVVETIAGRTP